MNIYLLIDPLTATKTAAWMSVPPNQAIRQVRKSPVFKRLGDDLMADVHVSLSEATAGPDVRR